MVRFFIRVNFYLNASPILWSIFILFFFTSAYSQNVKKEFSSATMDSAAFKSLFEEYGKNKKLPVGFESQTLIALSFYPELKQTKIKFFLKNK